MNSYKVAYGRASRNTMPLCGQFISIVLPAFAGYSGVSGSLNSPDTSGNRGFLGKRVKIFSIIVLSLFSAISSAQIFSGKPIRIVASAPGGGNDFVARVVAPALAPALGQQVIVENRASIVSIESVSKAAPDGYTLLAASQTHWIGPLLRKLSYDPVKDFSPVTITVKSPVVLVVHPSLPVKSVKELIALARSRPGELNFGSPAMGSANHIAAELFRSMAGVKMVHIPFNGSGPAIISLLGGHVQMLFPSPAGAIPHIKTGKLKGLAVSSAMPSALMPGLPTIAEVLPGYDIEDSKAIFAPKGTPAVIVNQLYRGFVVALNQADVKETFYKAGMEPVGSSPEQLGSTMEREIVQLGKLIKDSGIRADNAGGGN